MRRNFLFLKINYYVKFTSSNGFFQIIFLVSNEESGHSYGIVENGCPAGIVDLAFMTDSPFSAAVPSQVSFMNFRFDIGTPHNETQVNFIKSF